MKLEEMEIYLINKEGKWISKNIVDSEVGIEKLPDDIEKYKKLFDSCGSDNKPECGNEKVLLYFEV